MTKRGDNVVNFPTRRARAEPEESVGRSAQREADRLNETLDLLEKLRRRKRRIDENDRPLLASNLGRIITAIEPTNRNAFTKTILDDKWEKRKRYVQYPGEAGNARYAASGGDFAGLIDQLIKEKVRRGLDATQATIETVRYALKGTSFYPSSRFQMPEGGDDAAAAYLITQMEKVLDKLAGDADLAQHFKLVSMYPIYPDCPYWWFSASLTLSSKEGPNDIYYWDWLTDEDEFDLDAIPWWAPRCLIGQLYIPFESRCLHLPEQGVVELKKACGGEVTADTWSKDHSQLLQPFLSSECIRPRSVYHRLPLLLAALPRPDRLVPCLHATISRPTGLQTEIWHSYNDPIVPCFVANIGDQIKADDVFFCDDTDDEYSTLYVSCSDSSILVMGSGVDHDLYEFKPDFSHGPSDIDEIPDWLHSHPVQRLLKLTMDSDTAKRFALSPRNFPEKWFADCETVFRPNFPDSSMLTQLRQNTIGAYLLRNLVDADGPTIFEALKNDAIAKAAAAREVIDGELSKFRAAFDARYGK